MDPSFDDEVEDLIIRVKLPNGKESETKVPPQTPLNDLKTVLCSRYKLSPSAHHVEFVGRSSTNPYGSKRQASLALGKTDIHTAVIQSIEALKLLKENSMNTKENSVRVIVRLARSQQTILRVRPDEPLAKVFEALCNKVDIPNRDSFDFTHPTHPGGPLDLKCTLNDYKLRELHLTAKSLETRRNSSATTKKKRAPKPPNATTATSRKPSLPENKKSTKRRAAPPPPTPLSKTNSIEEDTSESKSDVSPSKGGSSPVSPLPGMVKTPLSMLGLKPSFDKDDFIKNTPDDSAVVPDSPKIGKEELNNEKTHQRSVSEVSSVTGESLHSEGTTDSKSLTDIDKYSQADDDDTSTSPTKSVEVPSPSPSKKSQGSVSKEFDESIEEEKENEEESGEIQLVSFVRKLSLASSEVSSAEEDAPEEETKSQPNPTNVLEDEEDNGIVLVSYVPKVETEESNLNGSTEVESSPVGKVEEEPVKEENSPIVVDIDIETPVEEAIVEKSVDDVKLDVNDNEEADDVNSSDLAEEITSSGAEEASEHSDHEEPSPTADDQDDEATSYEIADEDQEITPEEKIEDLKQEIEVENSPEEDLTSIDDLPPPPGAFYEPEEDDINKEDHSETSTDPEPLSAQADKQVKQKPIVAKKPSISSASGSITSYEADDISIGEESIDTFSSVRTNGSSEMSSHVDGDSSSGSSHTNGVADDDLPLPPPPSVNDEPKTNGIDSTTTTAGLSEAEKTEAEIAKLQAAIKEMKTKNTVKKDPGQDMFQRMKNRSNSNFSSTQTYTFVPKPFKKVEYKDYKTAGNAIEISEDGEIKGLRTQSSNDDSKDLSQSASKSSTALPSYYKRFLGIQAFKEGSK